MSAPEDKQFNPYSSPEYHGPVWQQPVDSGPPEMPPLPCPHCGSEGAQPVPYSAWHGRRAPRAIQEVACPKCGAEYNGETGVLWPPRSSKTVWFVVAVILSLLYILWIVLTGP